jgi:hypothetical protein
MYGTDADAVKTQVTGMPDNLPGDTPFGRIPPVKKEQKPKDTSKANIALISLLFLLFFGIVCAALYFFGFFGAWAEETIDYGLMANLPDDEMTSIVYISADEGAFKEASSLAGELLGGGLLKDIKKANIAYIEYSGGASGYAVYLESGQSVTDFLDKAGSYLNLGLSSSQNKLVVEKKNAQGIEYYLIKPTGEYSFPFCAWQWGRGIVLLYYGGGYSGTNKEDCSSLIGRKYPKESYEERLKLAEYIRRDLKTEDMPYAQGWFWTGSSDSYAADKSGYGLAYSDKDGVYLYAAAVGSGEENTPGPGLCEGGSIIKSSGKEACFKGSSASSISLMPLSSAVSYERGVGGYTIYAIAYPKSAGKESVKKKAEKFIFSAGLNGAEKKWADRKTLTVTVKDYDTRSPVAGVRLTVNNDDTKISQALTDQSGVASFKDLPIEFLSVEAEKDGYDSESEYVSATYTDVTIDLGKEEPLSPASKPKCGNYMCESGENCGNCPRDCTCYKGECVKGACRTVPYSIELPSLKNRSWNITYTPIGEKIKVQSDNCFYLDLLYPSGEEIEPYDADVKKCVSAHGVKYNTTGPGAAPWFNWGCASEKYFLVAPGTDLILRAYTESCPGCACYHPQFNVYDEINGQWVKYSNKTGR